MKFQLIFDKTGDSIPLVSMNPDVVSYYVEQLDQRSVNRFVMKNQSWAPKLSQYIENIGAVIKQVNTWLPDLVNKEIVLTEQDNFYNQNTLNRLHAEWVNSQTVIYDIDQLRLMSVLASNLHELLPDDMQQLSFGTIISKLKKSDEYDRINHLVHNIETSFAHLNFSVKNESWIEFPNPFDKTKILSNDLVHFRLHPNHLGRLLYEKFIAFDNNFEHNDENSYNELLGFVSLHLIQPQTIPVSCEYLEWCKKHGKQPLGNYLNFGNIPDISTKLEDYRMIVHRNVIEDNHFSIII